MASLHSQTPAAAVQVGQEVGVAWKFLLGPQTCPFQDTSRTATAGSSSLDQPQTKPWAGPPSQSIPCWCSPLMCLKHHLVLSMVIVTRELASLLFGSQEKNWHFKAFAPIQRFITCQREKNLCNGFFCALVVFSGLSVKRQVSGLLSAWGLRGFFPGDSSLLRC